MRCPALADLPPPPAGKTGWPWTTETSQLPAVRPDGSPWPRISIVTPSYNQGQFIEETLRSVLLQGYPDLEYIVIDGGSTDGAVDIIRKYAPWLNYWTSEPDRGQAHAINKGMARTTGVIGAYLNSDDYYLLGALPYAAQSFLRLRCDLLIGRPAPQYRSSWRWLRRSWWSEKLQLLPPVFLVGRRRYGISQESTFWNLAKYRHLPFDESLHFCLDVDWFCRIARGATIGLSARRIGFFRHHPASKSATLQHVAEAEIDVIVRRELELGSCEAAYAQFRSTLLRNLPCLIGRGMIFGAMEFSYKHPPSASLCTTSERGGML